MADEEVEEDPFAEPEEKPKVKTRKKKATKVEDAEEPKSDLNDILSKFAPSDDVDDNE